MHTHSLSAQICREQPTGLLQEIDMITVESAAEVYTVHCFDASLLLFDERDLDWLPELQLPALNGVIVLLAPSRKCLLEEAVAEMLGIVSVGGSFEPRRSIARDNERDREALFLSRVLGEQAIKSRQLVRMTHIRQILQRHTDQLDIKLAEPPFANLFLTSGKQSTDPVVTGAISADSDGSGSWAYQQFLFGYGHSLRPKDRLLYFLPD